MQEAFLVASGGRAMLLPRIRPISEDEEELTLLSGLAADVAIRPEELELPPAVSEIERRIALTMLVSKWSQSKRRAQAHAAGDMATVAGAAGDTPAKAANLAADLCRLMDMVETEDKDFAGLAELVPEEFSEHWQQTIEFLKIITEAWPAHLAERGLLSPVGRRNRAILAEAERLAAAPPTGPVIVAGVTGSIPATVALMRAVARLPKGAIVLPGLDPHLDEESWQTIVPADASEPGHPEHPQFGLKKLLDRLELKREDVRALGDAKASVAGQGRAELMAEAMRPSGTTGKWYAYTKRADRTKLRAALDGVSLIEAPSAQDEAEVVSLILREAAETPGRTAALISPDRLLARRVAIRLEAWGIRVDDSAGRPFAKTVPGTFLDLAIAAIAQGFAPADAMALLKHPLTRLGLGPFEVRRAGRALEIAVFRDVYLGQGSAASKRRSSGPTATFTPMNGAEWQSSVCATTTGRARTIWSRAWKRRSRRCSPCSPRGKPVPLSAIARRAHEDRGGTCAAARRRSGRGYLAALARRGRHHRGGVLHRHSRSKPAGARNARRRLRRSLPQPHRRRERAPARCRASAPLHLGTVRGAPAADRHRRPGRPQRRHLARGRRAGARGSTGRCARHLGCRRRRRRSATPHTTSRRSSAPSASISRARRRSTACRRCPRAG